MLYSLISQKKYIFNIYEFNLRIRPDDDGPGTLIISSDN